MEGSKTKIGKLILTFRTGNNRIGLEQLNARTTIKHENVYFDVYYYKSITN